MSGVSGDFAIGARLQEILHELGLTQAAAAELAGVDPSTINDIIKNKSPQLSVRKLKQILDGLGVTMGRFFREPSLTLTEHDAALAEDFRELLGRFLETDAALKAQRGQRRPQTSRRRKAASRTVVRGVVSAGPREMVPDVHHLPMQTIPADFYARGARLAYEVEGDSMIEAGIFNGAILFVRPTIDVAALDGRIAICRLNGAEYVKRVDTRSGRILLHSENPRYAPMPVDEDVDSFRAIGEVIL
jgi:SOS-response transcriptional repressor LexA